MGLTEFSLKRPITILMVFTCLLTLGLIATKLLPLEFFPDVEMPGVYINVPYPSSTPEEVERLITRPAEEVLGTISGIKRLVSDSREDGAGIRLEFKWGESATIKAMEVREKLDGIRDQFPPDLERYFVNKWSSSDWAILNLRISSTRDLSNAYDRLNRNVKRRLERVVGVSRVELYGVEKKEILIELLADRINAHHVDLNHLSEVLQRSNFAVTAGKLTDARRRFVVRPVGAYRSLDDIENLVIGAPNLRLRDIAQVRYDHPTLNYGRHLDRRYAIGVDIYKEAGANTVAVAERIIAEIEDLSRNPEMEGIRIFYMDNQAEGILSSLRELFKSGAFGALLAFLVLYFFLRQIRATLIVALAVPFSLLVTLAFLYFFGLSLNILTMMGLMLSVGMLVDNAVVVTESIYRRRPVSGDLNEVVTTGVREVGLAITAGTLTTAIVFLPNIVNPQDEVSTYLKHVGITIVIALGASLIIARTVVPLLASRLGFYQAGSKDTVIDKLIRSYRRLLDWMIRHRKISIGIILLVLLSVAVPISFVKKDLFPPQEDRKIRLHYHINGSYQLAKVEAAVDVIEDYLFAHQERFEIKSVYSYYQGNYASSTLILLDKEQATKSLDQLKEEIREDLPKLAIGDPSFEYQRSTGSGEGVRIQLVGESSAELAKLSHKIEWVLAQVDGLSDVRSEVDRGEEEVLVVVDRERTRPHGISTREVATTVAVAMRGQNLRPYHTAEGEVRMRVKLQREDQKSLADLQNLPVFNSRGEVLKLGSIADFQIRRAPQSVHRENRKTVIGVTANLEDLTVDEAKQRIRSVLDRYRFPTGYSWDFGRVFSFEDEAGKVMLINTILALILIYFLMAALFESLLYPAAIWSSILFAVIGVWWFFMATGTNFSIMAWIGVLILIGVVVNNGIVLIDHVNQLRARGLSRAEAILEGGQDRLRPILMTAGTTILGLLPLCFGTTLIGGDGPPYYPMARAIVGGLAFSTIVTLIFLPTIYILLDDLRNWSRRILSNARPN